MSSSVGRRRLGFITHQWELVGLSARLQSILDGGLRVDVKGLLDDVHLDPLSQLLRACRWKQWSGTK